MAYALARLVRLAVGVVVLIIVVGGVLFLVSANPSSAIVHDIHDAASTLVGPFKNLFSFSGHPKATLAVNWGLAAIVYLSSRRRLDVDRFRASERRRPFGSPLGSGPVLLPAIARLISTTRNE
jgi:hypothetical protein